MSRSWQLQEAKNRLSEVVDEALKEGPQVITRRGVETAIVLSSARVPSTLAPSTEALRLLPCSSARGCRA